MPEGEAGRPEEESGEEISALGGQVGGQLSVEVDSALEITLARFLGDIRRQYVEKQDRGH